MAIVISSGFRGRDMDDQQDLVDPTISNQLINASNFIKLSIPFINMEHDRHTSGGDQIGKDMEANNTAQSHTCGVVSFSNATIEESREPDGPCGSSSSILHHDPNDDIAALAAAKPSNRAAPADNTVEACHSSIFPFSKVNSENNPAPLSTLDSLPDGLKAEDAFHSLKSVATNEAALIDPTAPPWTAELHRQFVAAIFEVGLKNCSPSVIMENMRKQPKYITRERTKSHLQKYRQTRERSKDDFLTEYDAFLAVTKTVKEATTGSTGKEPIPRAVLAAALGGKKTSKLLGGEPAAVLTFSVLNNCSTDHGPDQIPYRAVKTAFPQLTDKEKESSLGTSLLFVKGMLHNMTDVLLKARHGISKPLEEGESDEGSSSSSDDEEESSDEEEVAVKAEVEGSSTTSQKGKSSSAAATTSASLQTKERKAQNMRFGYPGPFPAPPKRGPPPPSYGMYPPHPPYYGGPPMPSSMHPPHGPFYHHIPYGPPPGVMIHPHTQVPLHYGAHSDPMYASHHERSQPATFPPGHSSYPAYHSYNNDEYHPYASASYQTFYQEEDHPIDKSHDDTPVSRTADQSHSDSRFEPWPLDNQEVWKESDRPRKRQPTRLSTLTSPLVPEKSKRRAQPLQVHEAERLDSMFSTRARAKSPINSQASPIQSRKKRTRTNWPHEESVSPTANSRSSKILKQSRPLHSSSFAKHKPSPAPYPTMDTTPTAANASGFFQNVESPSMGKDKKNSSPDFFFDAAARFSPSDLSVASRISHDGHNLTGTWEPLAIDVQERNLDQKKFPSRPDNGDHMHHAETPGQNYAKEEDLAHESSEPLGTTGSQHRRSKIFFGE